MSRSIEYGNDGQLISQTVESMDECRDLIDGVCTNPYSDQCCDYPHPDYCTYVCPHFKKEDGII